MKNLNTVFLANTAAGGNNLMMIGLFIILIAFTYFAMIRPQKKQQQKRMQMMDQLKKGDHVVLVDGLHAKIDSINDKDKTVVVDADGIYLTFSRMAVRQIIPATPAYEDDADKTESNEKVEEAPKAEEKAPETSEDKSTEE